MIIWFDKDCRFRSDWRLRFSSDFRQILRLSSSSFFISSSMSWILECLRWSSLYLGSLWARQYLFDIIIIPILLMFTKSQEINSYIHFLGELTTGKLNLADSSEYIKGKHSIQMLKLRFDKLMINNINDPSITQEVLGILEKISKKEAKKAGRKSHIREFMMKSLQLYFSQEEINCLGELLKIENSVHNNSEAIAQRLERFLGDFN